MGPFFPAFNRAFGSASDVFNSKLLSGGKRGYSNELGRFFMCKIESLSSYFLVQFGNLLFY